MFILLQPVIKREVEADTSEEDSPMNDSGIALALTYTTTPAQGTHHEKRPTQAKGRRVIVKPSAIESSSPMEPSTAAPWPLTKSYLRQKKKNPIEHRPWQVKKELITDQNESTDTFDERMLPNESIRSNEVNTSTSTHMEKMRATERIQSIESKISKEINRSDKRVRSIEINKSIEFNSSIERNGANEKMRSINSNKFKEIVRSTVRTTSIESNRSIERMRSTESNISDKRSIENKGSNGSSDRNWDMLTSTTTENTPEASGKGKSKENPAKKPCPKSKKHQKQPEVEPDTNDKKHPEKKRKVEDKQSNSAKVKEELVEPALLDTSEEVEESYDDYDEIEILEVFDPKETNKEADGHNDNGNNGNTAQTNVATNPDDSTEKPALRDFRRKRVPPKRYTEFFANEAQEEEEKRKKSARKFNDSAETIKGDKLPWYDGTKYKCGKCNRPFRDTDSLGKHLRDEHDLKSSSQEYKNSVRMISKSYHKCLICNREVPRNRQNIRNHVRGHEYTFLEYEEKYITKDVENSSSKTTNKTTREVNDEDIDLLEEAYAAEAEADIPLKVVEPKT